MHMPRRFDKALMAPPDASAVADPALLALISAWCETGAFPVMSEPLRVARLASDVGLDHAACALDGSHELARLGRWRGMLWRLQILWRECVTTTARPGDPWDCGWWRDDGSLAAAQSFQPRRATLLMLREPAPEVAAALLSTLQARSPSYARPVRVLVVSSSADGWFSTLPSA